MEIARTRNGMPFRHQKALSLFLMVLVLSPSLTMPLSVPIRSDVIVVMYHDAAVDTAINQILQYNPKAQVVEYNSLSYLLVISRTIGQVVWISHGTQEGIMSNNGIMPWYLFSNLVDNTIGKDIVIACNSGEIYNYVSESAVIGINGMVDAVLGGLLAAYVLSTNGLILESIFSRISQLISGIASPQLLAPFNLQLAFWIDWTGIHGSITVSANMLDFLLYVCMALVIAILGSAWDAIGVVLDCFDISFGNFLLDWIWPVLIKPFLQVLLVGALGFLSAVIAAAKSVIIGMATLYLLNFLTSAITYTISQLVGAFLRMFGSTWLLNIIGSTLLPTIEDKLSGPIGRALAVKLGGSLGLKLSTAISKIGFGLFASIIISGLESTFDWFSYTYASGFTIGGRIGF